MKRKDALRKVRTICQRLDEIDLNTFPVWPQKLYLFGSVLTDKPDPSDIDLVLIQVKNPHISYSPEKILYILTYKPSLIPENRARVALRCGMKNINLHVESSLETWSDLLLFPNGEGLQIVWKPGLQWKEILDEIETNPARWIGPRPADTQEKLDQELKALSFKEIEQRIHQSLAAVEAREQASTLGLGQISADG
jgi:hypothetical protein